MRFKSQISTHFCNSIDTTNVEHRHELLLIYLMCQYHLKKVKEYWLQLVHSVHLIVIFFHLLIRYVFTFLFKLLINNPQFTNSNFYLFSEISIFYH